ncbi:hypothetical protein ACEYW6_18715 [Nostoc sp. UIC 10607]|uniref:hypothetical protein n=1 Tax=unclassified Nostoc TaxID=2593658 RepID=UPI001E30FB32|nr:hypothetical protein [Nostoc sp. NZL]
MHPIICKHLAYSWRDLIFVLFDVDFLYKNNMKHVLNIIDAISKELVPNNNEAKPPMNPGTQILKNKYKNNKPTIAVDFIFIRLSNK